MWKNTKETILDIFWPKRCINCGREGKYLCDDCFALIDISRDPPSREFKNLDRLYWATSYKEKLVQSAIHLCKYAYIKELSKTLSDLIIAHFKLLDKFPLLPASPTTISPEDKKISEDNKKNNFLICGVPLHKSKLKRRGFNQSEEIAKHLSKGLNIPFLPKALIKTKKTLPQMSLTREERKKNLAGAFSVSTQKRNQIAGKNILLVDDVFTTGATMQEAAKALKQNHAQKVWGVVVARD